MAELSSTAAVIDELLKEITVSSTPSEEISSEDFRRPEVTSTLVIKVLEDILKDKCFMNHEFSDRGKACIENVDDLCACLSFLPDCLTKKTFPTTSREASWGKFHSGLVSNLPKLFTVTKLNTFSSWLSLKLFPYLLDEAFPRAPDGVDEAHLARQPTPEGDIVLYIAGSIVRKLCKSVTSDSELDILDKMVRTFPFNQWTTLSEELDTEGLLQLPPHIRVMFLEMEDVFRSLFSGDNDVHFEQFLKVCMDNDLVISGFYDTVYESDTTDAVKLKLFKEILGFYFHVRVHHKCRKLMEECQPKKKVSRKQKALRKTLKS